MLGYEPATGHQYALFLRLVRDDAADYLDRALELMDLTWEEFSQLFRSVGQVVGVYLQGEMVGFSWVEERDAVLHLHALILKSGFRGKGIGSQILRDIEAGVREGVDAIELGVHVSNDAAKRLYERIGYRKVRALDELGFVVMQKSLTSQPPMQAPGRGQA
jgi:ribosomal protein S18 acetylase RimI-like enzyme